MEKYLLDTNIILEDPYILNKFSNAEIFIPSIVLEELDKKKSDRELGIKVRIFSRILDKLHETNYVTENNSVVIFLNGDNFGEETNDNKIINWANKVDANLISNDILMRIKARSIGLSVSGLTSESTENHFEDSFKGYFEYYLEDEIINTLYRDKIISIDFIKDIIIYPHMFIILKRYSGKSGSLIGKIDKSCRYLELIEDLENIWGISPKNSQQLMALHLLLDDEIPLVTLEGQAGTGKTLLALASGLLLTQDKNIYNKLVLTKPIIDMGKELGTLPGDKLEKLNPYVESYYDALEFLFGGKKEMYDALNGIQNVEIDALNYIRGRSLPNQLFIVDEAQNLTKHEIKTIITRIGEGSKIIIMGDSDQIDLPYLDKYNNGLSYVIDKFKDKNLAGHIKLEKGVRSGLASMAAEIL